MRPVIYEDDDGYLHRVLIKDDDPDSMAKYGIRAGPPDLHDVDWNDIIKEMNNVLVKEGLFMWPDVNANPVGFEAALNVVRRRLIQYYKYQYQQERKRADGE